MIETKEREIDGDAYMVTQFPARRAMKVQARLLKLLGPAIASLMGGVKGVDDALELGKLADAVQRLAMALDPNDFESLVMELLAMTRKNGKEISSPAVFDAEFSGSLLTVYKVLAFVLEVNFRDFFGSGGIGSLAAKIGGLKTPVPPNA